MLFSFSMFILCCSIFFMDVRLQNDLFCVEWDVKTYSVTTMDACFLQSYFVCFSSI